MEQQLKTITKKELPALLKKSEQHAIQWGLERDEYRTFYRQQFEKGYLSMAVSRKTVKRALMILERFITTCMDAGFSVTVERNSYNYPSSAVICYGELVSFRIKEKRVSQKKEDGRFSSRILVPTGRLELEVYAGYFEWKPSKIYADTEYTKIEDKMDDIVPHIKKSIEELKAIKQHIEEQRREQQEKERKIREHNDALKTRAFQVKSILRDIQNFEKARVIRDYCNMIEPITNSESYIHKIRLARRFADWIDPTVDYVDELAEIFKVSDF